MPSNGYAVQRYSKSNGEPPSRIATTADVYMQEIPESVQKTVDAISADLRLLPSLEEVTHGTSVLLPDATNLEKGNAEST